MDKIERKRNMKTKLLILFIVVVVWTGVKFPEMQEKYIKFMALKTKKEQVVTKTLTKNDILQLSIKQLNQIDHYNKNEWGWWKTEWLWREIIDGLYTIEGIDSFMSNHPENDLAKSTFHVTKYKVEGKTVEFISRSKIIQVHSKDGWKDITK